VQGVATLKCRGVGSGPRPLTTIDVMGGGFAEVAVGLVELALMAELADAYSLPGVSPGSNPGRGTITASSPHNGMVAERSRAGSNPTRFTRKISPK
jgi:hypothetical protein